MLMLTCHRWNQDCNMCQCINEEAACTRGHCRPAFSGLPEICLKPPIDPNVKEACLGFEYKWTYKL